VVALSAETKVPEAMAEPFWNVVRENIDVLADLRPWWDVFAKGESGRAEDEDAEFVAQALSMLGEPPYTAESWGAWTTAVKEATGRKGQGLFMPLRRAVTGRDRGPEMADVLALMQVKPRV